MGTVSQNPGRIVVEELPNDSALIERLVEWQVEEYATTIPSYDRASWQAFYREWTERPAGASLPVVFAGFEDGEFFGSVAIVADDDLPNAGHWTPWIASMIVRSDARGRGRGQHLLDAALRRCRELGIAKIHLWTEHRQAWYSRLGWTVEDEREFRGVPITVMSLELN